MPLDAGTRLAHYEITSPIGKGGMGEVYRARDTKLGRDVAIKVLPAEFSQDAERLARLEREARMLAALNHPNIAAIHGLEESGETRFLVLELVEGETLADRLKGGAVPVEESLKLSLQIAEALEAAHEKGVIHRDLKPANIKVTPEGRVKVLDFGLAKAFAGDSQAIDPSNSPTLSMQATRAGVIMGTAAYMAPEQARGGTADQRSDIWAFATVLFQLLTGEGAFDGTTVSDILASVLKTDPDWSALPPSIDPRVRFLLERCLEKDPRERCQTMAEARAEIQKALVRPSGNASSVVAAIPSSASSMPWIVAVGLALVVGLAAWFLKPVPEAEAGFSVRFGHELAAGQDFRASGRDVVAISPDGRTIVYNATDGIYVRDMDQMEARLIAGTEGQATNPFFSPDGEWIGFWSATGSELRKIRVSGGASVLLTAAANPQGASWAPDNTIVFGQADGIMRVSGDGGEAELVVPSGDALQLWDPQVLPNGFVLFTAWHALGDGRVSVADPGSGESTELFAGERAVYVPTGHLVVTDPETSPNTVLARTFDPDTLGFGGAVPIQEGAATFQGRTHFAVAPSGSLAYVFGNNGAAGANPERTLTWVDREGGAEPIAVRPGDYTAVRVSPDGTKVAVVVGSSIPLSDPPPDIWILDLTTGTFRQLTFNADIDDTPVWDPGSDLLYYRSFRDGAPAIYSIPADGGDGAAALVASSDEFNFPSPWSISSDGQTLTFNYGDDLSNINVATLSLGPEPTFNTLLAEPGLETEPMIAPNGQWLAYQFTDPNVSNEEVEISLRPLPALASQRIPIANGRHPVFSADGSELLYFDLGGISVVPLSYEPSLSRGDSRPLFRGTYQYGSTTPDGGGGRAWDYDSTRDRFLMINLPGVAADEGAEAGRPQVNVVVNWFHELLERAPVD